MAVVRVVEEPGMQRVLNREDLLFGLHLTSTHTLPATMLSAKVLRVHHSQSISVQCAFAARVCATVCSQTRRSFSVGVVGCGSMGRTIIQRLVKAGLPLSKLVVVTRRPDEVKRQLGFHIPSCSSEFNSLARVRIVFICCLPSQLPEVASKLRCLITQRQLVVSIVGGCTEDRLESLLNCLAVWRVSSSSVVIRTPRRSQAKRAPKFSSMAAASQGKSRNEIAEAAAAAAVVTSVARERALLTTTALQIVTKEEQSGHLSRCLIAVELFARSNKVLGDRTDKIAQDALLAKPRTLPLHGRSQMRLERKARRLLPAVLNCFEEHFVATLLSGDGGEWWEGKRGAP